MRYIGNKSRILHHIDKLIEDKQIKGGIFADLFTGTGSVADHFKDRFEILTNDLLYYASVFSEAKINFDNIPDFINFRKNFSMNPFEYWNSYDFTKEPYGFVSLNFSPLGNRQFFQEKNAIKIDTIRRQIEKFRVDKILNENEYSFLLASLLESVMRVSNTSGTYEAFFKNWESRSNKDFLFTPLSIEKRKVFSSNNKTYNKDANELVREIEGEVAYIDTPYTVTQYASAYHVLETIALNDNPEIAGKTGRRVERKMSNYSKRKIAKFAFEDLLRQLNFNHVIISYSNQSLIPLDELIYLASKFAIDEKIEVRTIDYREYRNLNSSQKSNGTQLQEVLIYLKKDKEIIKSPLNYAGSKDLVMKKIIKSLPQHITNFVDMMGGAFNVGANNTGTGKVFYNENNFFVYYIIEYLLKNKNEFVLEEIKHTINKYQLSKTNKENYIKFRNYYNSLLIDERQPIDLFVLTLYSFQHMIRFNSKGGFNVPVGNSGLTTDIINRIYKFRTKMPIGELILGSFEDIDINNFDKDTIFYFDPPYIITAAAYNDGRRFISEWTINNELKLLNFLDKIDNNKQKFLLSNVIEHNGKTNELLTEWVDKGGYNMEIIGITGRRYPRTEVIIKNY